MWENKLPFLHKSRKVNVILQGVLKKNVLIKPTLPAISHKIRKPRNRKVRRK